MQNWLKGAPAFAGKADNISNFENIILLVAEDNITLQYTGSRPFFSLPCHRHAWWSDYKSTDLKTIFKRDGVMNQQ
jgi:hypothetical protein